MLKKKRLGQREQTLTGSIPNIGMDLLEGKQERIHTFTHL